MRVNVVLASKPSATLVRLASAGVVDARGGSIDPSNCICLADTRHPTPDRLIPVDHAIEGQCQAVGGEEVGEVKGAVFGFEQDLFVEVAGGAIAQAFGL